MDLKQHIRTVLDHPIEGIKFRDITSLTENPKAFHKTLIDITSECMDFTVDTIVAIESRGFVFGSAVARDLEVPFVMARKPGKLPNETVSKEFKLEYGETELHLQKISPIQGRVVVIDDLIATGGTAKALASLIAQCWKVPKENILILAVIDLPDLGGRAIIESEGFNVEALIEFEGE